MKSSLCNSDRFTILKKCFNHTSAESAETVENTYCIFCKGVRPLPNKCPGYDIKPSDAEAPTSEILGMRNISSLPLLPGPLWVVAPDMVK